MYYSCEYELSASILRCYPVINKTENAYKKVIFIYPGSGIGGKDEVLVSNNNVPIAGQKNEIYLLKGKYTGNYIPGTIPYEVGDYNTAINKIINGIPVLCCIYTDNDNTCLYGLAYKIESDGHSYFGYYVNFENSHYGGNFNQQDQRDLYKLTNDGFVSN